jgi:hypothetical protein
MVKYKYLKQDVGLIVEQSTRVEFGGASVTIYKVIWSGHASNQYETQQWDWMKEEGLEVISGSG